MTAALIILTAGFYAQNSEETYPSGPSYDIGISDAHGQSLSTLIDLATSHHVTLAKVTYEPDGHGGNSRIISIFGSLGNKNGIHADSPYPDYGFGLRTQVQRGDEFTDPLGRWLLYGSPQETASVAQSMLDCGFELNKSNSVSVARITCQFFLNSIAQIVFVGLAVMFASGALSASVASRVCAIQALHGVGTAGIIIRQFLQHALFFHHLCLYRMDNLDRRRRNLLVFRIFLRIRGPGISLHHYHHNMHGADCVGIGDYSGPNTGAVHTQTNSGKATIAFSHGLWLCHGSHRAQHQLRQSERRKLQMAPSQSDENHIGTSIIHQQCLPIATMVHQ